MFDTVLGVYHRFDEFYPWTVKSILQRLRKLRGPRYPPEGQLVESRGVFKVEPSGCRPIAIECLESSLGQVTEYAATMIVDDDQSGVAVSGG